MDKFLLWLQSIVSWGKDGDGLIESYKDEVAGVFSQFNKMHLKLAEVNDKLQTVIEDQKIVKETEEEKMNRIIAEVKEKMALSDSVIEKAINEIKANSKLQEKVEEFIK